MRALIVVVPFAALLGCSNGLSPITGLTGTWSAPPFGDNSSLVLNVVQLDDVITGSGKYTIKVWVDTVQQTGPTYTTAIAGTYHAPAIQLVLTYQQGPGTSAMAFSGAVDDSEHLSGRLDFGGDRVQLVTFTRR